ncbi:hypothetical protein HPP92_004774 [Vanilla planifolia]|uniref:Uncharacterized protein n=1 Tax=Vanilla planifolia TaxID=51239 RepID=A0A835RFT7_VANPL|nr:hypothetical protein HPP92_004774 [Vanilla planifolia]
MAGNGPEASNYHSRFKREGSLDQSSSVAFSLSWMHRIMHLVFMEVDSHQPNRMFEHQNLSF